MIYFHPWESFIPEGASTLIIGSIPPARFCEPTRCLGPNDVDFYYGSSANAFWDLFGQATGRSFSSIDNENAVNERKRALADLGIGITDIVASCTRVAASSEDKALENISPKSIKALLEKHTSIKCIYYTSSFVRSQVRKALGRSHKRTPVEREWIMPVPRALKAVELFSPSPSALRGLGPNGEQRRLEQYKKYFMLRLTDSNRCIVMAEKTYEQALTGLTTEEVRGSGVIGKV